MTMKTKADFQERGRDHARNKAKKHPYMRSSNSWQASAYWAAYDEEQARLDASAAAFFGSIHATESGRLSASSPANSNAPKGSGNMLKPIPPEEMPQTGMVGWPQGAAEHASRLKHALSTELKAKRAMRLLASLKRLYARHDRHA